MLHPVFSKILIIALKLMLVGERSELPGKVGDLPGVGVVKTQFYLSHKPFINGLDAAVIIMEMSIVEAKSIKSSFKNSPPLSVKNPLVEWPSTISNYSFVLNSINNCIIT